MGDPIIFWAFSMDDLPEEACFSQEKGKINDDECHGNVKHLTDKKAGKIIKKQPLYKLMLCISSSVLPFDERYLNYRDRVS
ncbi:hypothetical protein ASN18_2288 [Candidatus Magnetominusculus xianensis]|uniref:Uncharacterized protein n=1 Tax=Candidatus Magnetominusculus xianensis TaxID=1748249 RepID=A0ABR5SD96_9BACT|nr:hypothetical protein ASN18_2288 [Candidatus Magnetominusculus xianensis]